MNIILCRGFVKDKKLTVILSCHRKLVDYYLPKCFVIIENNSSVLSYVPLRVKQINETEILHKNDFVMA